MVDFLGTGTMVAALRRLDDDVNRDLADYIGIKGELESHERERCKGAIVRSRVKVQCFTSAELSVQW